MKRNLPNRKAVGRSSPQAKRSTIWNLDFPSEQKPASSRRTKSLTHHSCSCSKIPPTLGRTISNAISKVRPKFHNGATHSFCIRDPSQLASPEWANSDGQDVREDFLLHADSAFYELSLRIAWVSKLKVLKLVLPFKAKAIKRIDGTASGQGSKEPLTAMNCPSVTGCSSNWRTVRKWA